MTGPLWSIEAFLDATGAGARGEMPDAVTGISIDSRTVVAGEAFFAILGDRFDGHDFVAKALSNGAGLAVVSADWAAEHATDAMALAVVDDVLVALEGLGRAARERTNAKILAVTGSVGKTSTKEALRSALSGAGKVHASVASFNNHWGVPLTLARMPREAEFGVFEVGMNHAGEIATLIDMIRPQVALVTNVVAVHIEYFENIEAIADAKAEIFTGLVPGGTAILNADNPLTPRLKRAARDNGIDDIRTFGEAEGADARLLDVTLLADRSRFSIGIGGAVHDVEIGAPGRHLVQNALGVLLAAHALGVDVEMAASGLAGLEQPRGRGRRSVLTLPAGEAVLIDESYNANPTSMRAALALLGQAPVSVPGRRIAVLGDMLELGSEAAQLHADLADPVEKAAVDLAFLSGPMMKSLWDALPEARKGAYAVTSEELESHVVAAVGAGDAIMVKGSLGSRMGPIVTALTERFAASHKE